MLITFVRLCVPLKLVEARFSIFEKHAGMAVRAQNSMELSFVQ
jgi:hypothetical protein